MKTAGFSARLEHFYHTIHGQMPQDKQIYFLHDRNHTCNCHLYELNTLLVMKTHDYDPYYTANILHI